MAKLFLIVGSLLFVVGIILTYFPWLLSWFGRLPGDIRIEGDGSFVFIPFTSMIVLSVVLSALLYLFGK